MRAIATAVMLTLVLAGCASNEEGRSSSSLSPTTSNLPSKPVGTGVEEEFDARATGMAPTGWSKTGGTWVVEANAAAPTSPNVVRGTGDANKGRSSFLDDAAGAYGNFEARVTFQLVSGEHPQGAGLSFRFADEQHYTLVRYSNSEQGWHLFVANGGDADKKGSATLPLEGALPGFGGWIKLRVRAQGDHVEAWWNETKVIDYRETSQTAARQGTAGLFLRGQTVALFDDFEVEPIV
jgi:hypothetical protein